MPVTPPGSEFSVSLTLEVAGPIRPRTKYKKNKLLRAEKQIMLPFAPYSGLYLTFSKPKKRGQSHTLFLRIRTAGWLIPEQRFECVVDEVLNSLTIMETMEVRGRPLLESHFVQLQRTLRVFEFDVDTNVDSYFLALDKQPDGTVIEPHG